MDPFHAGKFVLGGIESRSSTVLDPFNGRKLVCQVPHTWLTNKQRLCEFCFMEGPIFATECDEWHVKQEGGTGWDERFM